MTGPCNIRLSPMEFGMSFGRSGGPRPDEPPPMRILVLGDFSGREARGGVSPASAAQPVDIETLDDVMARLKVRANIAGQDVAFTSIDDLHPDALYQRLNLFAEGRVLRAKLRATATAAAAEAELNEWLGQAGAASAGKPSAKPAEQASAGASGDLMSQLLGGPAKVNQPTMGVDADEFIRKIMGTTGQVMPASAGALPRLDERLSTFMRGVLREPAFRAIEQSWRGLHWLINRLELDETLKLHIADASEADLLADMAAHTDPASSATAKTLAPGGVSHEAFHVVISLVPCRAEAQSVRLAAWLGGVFKGSLVAIGGEAGLAGCPGFGQVADPDGWTQAMPADAAEAWKALERASGSLVVATPRVILRQPYGAGSDEVDVFKFEEFTPEEKGAAHEAYLWGPASLAVGVALGSQFTMAGWDLDPGLGGQVEDLPVHSWSAGGQAQVKPCAEAWLSERAMQRLASVGLVAVASVRGRDVVLVSPLQTPAGERPKPAW